MNRGNIEDEDPESDSASDSLAADDSFEFLLALYRSRVYEQHHTLFTDEFCAQGTDSRPFPSVNYMYNIPR